MVLARIVAFGRNISDPPTVFSRIVRSQGKITRFAFQSKYLWDL